jgi:hypothetical protein
MVLAMKTTARTNSQQDIRSGRTYSHTTGCHCRSDQSSTSSVMRKSCKDLAYEEVCTKKGRWPSARCA